MECIIEIDKVYKKFGDSVVLNNINLSLEKGKIHGFIGRNGSGKTMLMKCICGFVPVTKGKILVYGKQVGKDVETPKNLGVIIETPGFLPNYSAYKNLKFLADISGKANKQQIIDAIKSVGLDPNIKKHVGNILWECVSVLALRKQLWKILICLFLMNR